MTTLYPFRALCLPHDTRDVRRNVSEAIALGTAVVVSSPLAAVASEVAQVADVTPSLKNLIGSVVAGGTVFGLLFGAVYVVSSFDKLDVRR